MELAALIINFGLLVVAGAAAAAAVVQARAATRARNDAQAALVEAQKARDETRELSKVATEAFVRQAAAQERRNDLKEKEMTPSPWAVRFVSGSLHQAVNNSGKAIRVDGFQIEPEGTQRRVQIRTPDIDGLYQYGDSFDFLVSKVMGPNARKLTIHWHFEDGEGDEKNAFIIPL